MNKWARIIVIVFLTLVTTISNAALITTDTITNPVVVDFSAQSRVNGSAGPLQIGGLILMDITVIPIIPGSDLYICHNGWSLISNGRWASPMTYISSQGRAGMRFAFNDGPVSEVGGFMNYAPDTKFDLIITALDANLNVLETYNISSLADIVTPGGSNAGAFRGISRPIADIAFFDVMGESPVLDDLTFNPYSAPSIPVPMTNTGLLVLAGLLGLFGLIAIRRNISDQLRCR